jgi:DnaD/phage-associated family protein
VSDARRRQSSHLPPSLIDRLIQDVWDPLETKVILAVATIGGADEPVAEEDVLNHSALRRGARGDGSSRDVSERLVEALHASVAHGILIALRDEDDRLWYVIATHQTQQIAREGQFEIVDGHAPEAARLTLERPDVFGLYEQNIGMVTPILADRLTEALQSYPEEWIQDAIAESVAYNRRSWRYIQRILENWSTEGRADETNRRDHEKHLDSEKYLRGKYAALFRKR